MDRRSFCKVLGFAAGSTLLPGLMVRAAGQSSVGRAVPDGRYAIGIRSDLSGCDLTHAFYYSDSFFTHPATQYDHQLALATLGLVCAAANTIASDAEYWVNGSVGREAHIAAAYETLGFEDALFCNYDLDTGRAGDFVGYSLARKTLTLNGQRTTLVALILRGGGYGGEWASNFHMGDTSARPWRRCLRPSRPIWPGPGRAVPSSSGWAATAAVPSLQICWRQRSPGSCPSWGGRTSMPTALRCLRP